jgi:hypothetical protein
MRTLKTTNTEWLQGIVKDYRAAGEPWPAESRMLAAWALSNNKWEPSRRSKIEQCAKEIAEAMRQEMEKDPQGRTVRAKYCARIAEADESGRLVQKTLWFDPSDPPKLMRRSLQQRRNGILGACKRLKTDQDSYNENNPHGAEINLTFDFGKDLADLEQDTKYNPRHPDGDAEED